jgi:phosphoenolpyruvate synthase/pyruvate phosphate dikinase
MTSIIDITRHRGPASVGNKAANIRKLARIGMRIPRTYVIPWDAYHRYLRDDTGLVPDLQNELSKIIDPHKTYAVRSSANIEDSLDRSFAGQFKSVLHVNTVDNIIQAAWSVWSSARTPAVTTYLERHNISTNDLSMAVLVQEMVKPVFSGVALSRNPVTGGDETVVEAIRGDGSLLVQSGLTPDRWVNKWGYWVEKAMGSDVPLRLIEEIISQTKTISKKLRHPVDLEWVYDGSDLYWVQVRAITTLNSRNVYSNYIPREMLPGMIKPLIFSINIPLVNSVWIRWISEITGDLGLKPEDLAKSIYYRVYFNMGALGDIFEGMGFPRESVEMIMGSLPRGAARPPFKPSAKTISRLPWLLFFMLDKWIFGPRMRRALPKLEKRVKATPYLDLDRRSESDLLVAIEKHYRLVQEIAYYNVMGPLLMGMYNNTLKMQLDKRGVDFTSFDLTHGMIEIAELDPATHLRRLNEEFRSFSPETQKKIREARYSDFQNMSEAGRFRDHVADLTNRFGHLSDNGNDFSAVPWRERPEMVLQLVLGFEPARVESKKITLAELQGSGQAGYLLKFFYHRAREFRLLREQVSGLYTHGYGLFRYYFLALGEHFIQRGLIDAPEDIFYLTYSQVRDLVNEKKPSEDLRLVIECHKADMERYRDILIPTVIHGDEIPPVREPNMDVLSGIPTSIGHYTGRVKVVRGIQDFPKVMQGDVLVIPYSDVGWTPLFARAGAVVAESGGLLSHSSIVAREYNIPAVVSVEGATLLPDKTLVTVDGHKGEILIHK